MNTVVNNPQSGDSGSGAWTVVGIIIGIIVILLLLYYGVPALRGTTPAVPNNDAGVDIDVDLPDGNMEGGGSTNP